jgi:hypothetical protein
LGAIQNTRGVAAGSSQLKTLAKLKLLFGHAIRLIEYLTNWRHQWVAGIDTPWQDSCSPQG